MSPLLPRLLLLVIIVLPGCALRSSQTPVAAPPDALEEADVVQLISGWQRRLCRYIARKGDGRSEVLSELRGLRSRDVLRPARITFGALGIGADSPASHGWDVQGVLVGVQEDAVFTRYVFVVGIVGYAGYLPSSIQDIRLVSLSYRAGMPAWQMSAENSTAVRRYRETFDGRGASRFPAHDDNFRMDTSWDRVSVVEARSGAGWSLSLRAVKAVAASPAYRDHSADGGAAHACP